MRTNMGTLTVPRTRNNCPLQTKVKIRMSAVAPGVWPELMDKQRRPKVGSNRLRLRRSIE